MKPRAQILHYSCEPCGYRSSVVVTEDAARKWPCCGVCGRRYTVTGRWVLLNPFGEKEAA